MTSRVAVLGGDFNPPGLHHEALVRALLEHFDRVVIAPYGISRHSDQQDPFNAVHRATMADLAFSRMDRVSVDLLDLEHSRVSSLIEIEERYRNSGEVWHALGRDILQALRQPTHWASSLLPDPEMLEKLRIVVFDRPGSPEQSGPQGWLVLTLDIPQTSALVRERRFRGEPIADLVAERIAEYLERHQLYRGTLPPRAVRTRLPPPRLLIVGDDDNPKSDAWVQRLQPFAAPDDPNLIVVVGGDGTMLHAIQQHWRLRVPFFGINAGHVGFLMNDAREMFDEFPPRELVLRQMPMIYAETQTCEGTWQTGVAFNDVWVERASGQTAWLQVSVNDVVRFKKMVCDGVLLSTAAGSTAYAASMGAMPLLADTPAWLIVGNNVMQPRRWKSAMLSLDDRVEIEVLDAHKRPVRAFQYGSPVGEVRRLRARLSRTASVEVGFCPEHDLSKKIAELQFPQS